MEYAHFLHKVPLFTKSEDDNELAELAGTVLEHHYCKKVTICHVNDHGNVMFVLKQCLVKAVIEDETGDEMIVRILY